MSPSTLVVDRLGVTFEAGRVQPIVTVAKLHDTTNSIANRGIVVRNKILQRLHEAALHVPSFSSLDGGIDQTFTTRDGVKQEFRGGETSVETVTDETLRRRVSRLLWEVRELAVLEAIGNTVAGDNLLSDTGHHLRDIDDGTCHMSVRITEV